ncbi:MazG-like pyrophosphatase [Pseudomonas phage WP1]
MLKCYQAAYDTIKDRKGVMYNGVFIKESDERHASIMAELNHANETGLIRLTAIQPGSPGFFLEYPWNPCSHRP